jgi:hypothetical protein
MIVADSGIAAQQRPLNALAVMRGLDRLNELGVAGGGRVLTQDEIGVETRLAFEHVAAASIARATPIALPPVETAMRLHH